MRAEDRQPGHRPEYFVRCRWRPVVFRESVRAETRQLQGLRQRLHRIVQAAGLTEVDADDLVLAVDEAVANVILHAYAGAEGSWVDVTVARGRADVMVVLRDSGQPFDFYGVAALDPIHQLSTGQRGGLGIYLIRNLADHLQYYRHGDHNRLVMVRGRRPV